MITVLRVGRPNYFYYIAIILFYQCLNLQFSSLVCLCRPAGEAPGSTQRPNASGGGGEAAGQREAEAPVCRAGQHHRALDSNQDGGRNQLGARLCGNQVLQREPVTECVSVLCGGGGKEHFCIYFSDDFLLLFHMFAHMYVHFVLLALAKECCWSCVGSKMDVKVT